jgi:hypothetical protein
MNEHSRSSFEPSQSSTSQPAKRIKTSRLQAKGDNKEAIQDVVLPALTLFK